MIRTDPSGVAFSHFDAERRAKRPTTHRRRAVSTSKSPKSFPDHRSAAAPGGTILAMLRNATVRARRPEEVDECVAMLELVHAADGYPSRLPEDPRRWLTPADTVGAWVAADPGGLSGHVALHRPTGDAESSWVCTTAGLPPEGTALVARLSSRRGRAAWVWVSHFSVPSSGRRQPEGCAQRWPSPTVTVRLWRCTNAAAGSTWARRRGAGPAAAASCCTAISRLTDRRGWNDL